ncbi:MAG: flippase-like domain-containing protein [Ignavibacteriales bacterium]|nr:MAG: flippase-like domain-containing protein [Ignavibacteriales bacterium]
MTSGNDKKSIHLVRILRLILSLLLTGVFLYIAFYGVDFSEVINISSRASVLWVGVFILLQYLSHFLRAFRWQIILKSVKPDTKLKNLFGAMMVGYGVNCVIPRLGEVTRAVLIGKWEGLSRSSMFGTVIVERVIDIVFLCLTVMVSVLIWSGNLYESFPWLKSSLIITAVIMAAVIIILYLIIFLKEKFYNLIIRIIGLFSATAAQKSAHIFSLLTEGFASLKGARNYLLTFGISVVMMLVYALNAYVGFFTLGMENIKTVSFEMGWILMSISAIGVVIPTPGGTGSYHTLAKTALVVLFGFEETISLAYAFLTHIISYSIFILTALIVFFILNKQHENIFKVVDAKLEET